MKTIAATILVAFALLSVTYVAQAQETCNSAQTCGDAWLGREFTGLDCPTSTVNVTYLILARPANQSQCLVDRNDLFQVSTKASCSRSAKRFTIRSYSNTTTCQGSKLDSIVNYPTGVCLNRDDDTNPTSVLYYCSFADTPSYTTNGHTALSTTAVPQDATCQLNSTSVNGACQSYAYVKTFADAKCSGTPTFAVASNVGAPVLNRCYIDRGSQLSVNVKSTCSKDGIVETTYSNGCVDAKFAYSVTWPVGVCIPSEDGLTSMMYGCPGSAASALSVSALALFLVIAALAVFAL